MANKVSIGIDAQLDAAGVTQGIDKITQHVAQANKQKFNPVDKATLQNLDAVNRKFQELLKVNRELNRRVKATGQSGAMFEDIDFHSIFPDQKTRARKLNQISQHVGMPAMQHGPGIEHHPGRPGGGGGFGAVAGQVAQAGLRAAGPAGGVAASAVSTGMSAGMGAGLMGLMGGMLALGVGKLVGGVLDKVENAESHNVALDSLKRTLGDVSVSFEGLKAVVDGGAENLRITYAEAGKLATQFAKLGNMKASEYTSIHEELGVGVGMSRAFGLDPSEGVGIMGQMRGLGVTGDVQESKRFALLIGETIGKSDAFAKADEVFSAIGGYAASQTRNTLGQANVQGYAGAFSALVGSGIPGLDPSGAGALLSRLNSSLAAGGAKGEASQYFTGMLGSKRGMDVFDTQLWREGGAFSTANSTFHGNGAVSQFYDKYGLKKPTGTDSLLGANLSELKLQYGKDPKSMLNATANQMGLSMSQAAALHVVDPNKMGELEGYAGDLTKLNAGGIANVAKAVHGTDADRKGLAESMLGRSDVSEADKDAIKDAMTKGVETQKMTLAKVAAQYDQEQTTGKDVRDSKNALENIKTAIADKLVPYFNEARLGIMSIAGVGPNKTTSDIMTAVIQANSEGRKRSIEGQFDGETKQLNKKHFDAMQSLKTNNDVSIYEAHKAGNPELAEQMKARQQQAIQDMKDVAERLTKIKEEKVALLKANEATTQRELDEMRKQDANRAMGEISPASAKSARAAPDTYDALFDQYGKKYGVDPKLLKAIAMKESGMNPAAISGANENGTRDYGLMQHNSKYMGGRGLNNDWHKPERSIEEAAKLLSDNIKRGGSVRTGVRMYNGSGPKAEAYADDVMGRYGQTKIKSEGTPLPADAPATSAAAGGGAVEHKGSIEVRLVDKNGRQVAPPQIAETRVKSNWNGQGTR